jgi:hypothetical protein
VTKTRADASSCSQLATTTSPPGRNSLLNFPLIISTEYHPPIISAHHHPLRLFRFGHHTPHTTAHDSRPSINQSTSPPFLMTLHRSIYITIWHHFHTRWTWVPLSWFSFTLLKSAPRMMFGVVRVSLGRSIVCLRRGHPTCASPSSSTAPPPPQ